MTNKKNNDSKMNYPENLKLGSTIGICAPSCGIVEKDKLKKLDLAIKQLEELGYKVKETQSVRNQINGRSNTAKIRAKEFMELYENPDVKLILCATGGDFLSEMLDELDWNKLKVLPPKWIQGYSDITGLGFLFNVLLDIPTMYCQTVKDYAMRPLYKNLVDALEIEKGNEVIQNSFEMHEKITNLFEETLPKEDNESLERTYNLTEKTEWKNLNGEKKIVIQGRTIGGCLDCIRFLFGTKYDKINEYINRHANDGIIWFLECFEMSTSSLYLTLWQMKNAGYFKNCSGVIFGRSLFMREDYDISFEETIKQAMYELKIPIILDADIGHVAPQLAIVNGALVKIESGGGKGIVYTKLK